VASRACMVRYVDVCIYEVYDITAGTCARLSI
jgi:hypothetical protein